MLRSLIGDVAEVEEGFLGRDLAGGVEDTGELVFLVMLDGVEDDIGIEGALAGVVVGTGMLVCFVMLEGVEDSESFGMLVRFWGWVSFDMLGVFWGSLSFVMLVLVAGSVAICMLGGIERSVEGIERTVASGRLGEIEG